MYAVFFHGASDDLLLKVVPTQHEAEDVQAELVEFYEGWLDECEKIAASGDPEKTVPGYPETVRSTCLPPQHPLVADTLKAWGRDFGGTVFGISVVPLDGAGKPDGYRFIPLD